MPWWVGGGGGGSGLDEVFVVGWAIIVVGFFGAVARSFFLGAMAGFVWCRGRLVVVVWVVGNLVVVWVVGRMRFL